MVSEEGREGLPWFQVDDVFETVHRATLEEFRPVFVTDSHSSSSMPHLAHFKETPRLCDELSQTPRLGELKKPLPG